jgi:hypothetical protein
MAGVVELSGSVIESPQGLHSNAYKFSARARLMICKVIGLPQTGQASTNPSLIRALCTRWRSATLTRINTSAKRSRADFACVRTASASRQSCFPQNSWVGQRPEQTAHPRRRPIHQTNPLLAPRNEIDLTTNAFGGLVRLDRHAASVSQIGRLIVDLRNRSLSVVRRFCHLTIQAIDTKTAW